MKMKKLISTGLSVLLAASLLAGCGSGKAPAASSNRLRRRQEPNRKPPAIPEKPQRTREIHRMKSLP